MQIPRHSVDRVRLVGFVIWVAWVVRVVLLREVHHLHSSETPYSCREVQFVLVFDNVGLWLDRHCAEKASKAAEYIHLYSED